MKKRLSQREKEIRQLILEGKTNKEICRILYISRSTLENHITKIYQKCDVKNRMELIFKYFKERG